ncbi:MAG: hypothetical protein H6725_09995 [Sandaracinaceae bacterium]|nr:hypothetical protein [Sandaracinaceae bacterium]
MPRRHPGPPYKFHFDACLGGRRIVEFCATLALDGEAFRAHAAVYDDGTPDTEWLPQCAMEGWVICTSDSQILRCKAECEEVWKHDGVLVVFNERLSTAGLETLLEKHIGAIRGHLQAAKPPFILRVSSRGVRRSKP